MTAAGIGGLGRCWRARRPPRPRRHPAPGRGRDGRQPAAYQARRARADRRDGTALSPGLAVRRCSTVQTAQLNRPRRQLAGEPAKDDRARDANGSAAHGTLMARGRWIALVAGLDRLVVGS
jgi:hypothetical protein